ncbi:MAG: multicopper oxidase family protein [Planctomycetes bacterium]|nr:multicopper oxidase family protein [Planctomycetota bacterium]
MHRTSQLALLAAALLAATLPAQNIIDATLIADEGTVDLGPGYAAEPAMLYNGLLPGPVIRATEGDTLRVRLINQLDENTILHFHGQPMRLGMDGTQRISRPETPPGQEFTYELDNLAVGTYWFHPHSDNHHQLDGGMYGVLIVDPANPANDPVSDLDQVIALDDWNAQVTGGSYFGHILNGRTSDGQAPILVSQGDKLRLRFSNMAARTNYVVALDGHPMTVTHKDGNRVQPVVTDAIPIGIGERYDVIVDCTNPGVWSLAVAAIQNRSATLVRGVVRYQGQTGADPAPTFVPPNLSSGALLGYAQLASYWPSAHPITAAPDRTYPMALAVQPGPGGGTWTINNEAWPNVTPTDVDYGEIIQFDLTTSTPSPNHIHPMHMHGHFVQLMGTAGGTTHPPLMDTVLIMPSGQPGDAWSCQWLADNPGTWLYHCHEMHHMMRGMMTVVSYVGDFDGDGIPDASDKEPTLSVPVAMISDDQQEFLIGNSGELDFQWQPNEWLCVFASPTELVAPQPMPPHGDLRIDQSNMAFLGMTAVGANGEAQLPYTLPNNLSFVGVRLFVQAVGSSSSLGTARLSVHQAFVVTN